MAIEFHCPGCGRLMRAPDEAAGRKGKCPQCGLKVMIPGQSLTAQPPIIKSFPTDARRATPAAPQVTSQLEFPCSHCHRRLKVAMTAAGRQGLCPGCKAVIQIPHRFPEAGKDSR